MGTIEVMLIIVIIGVVFIMSIGIATQLGIKHGIRDAQREAGRERLNQESEE